MDSTPTAPGVQKEQTVSWRTSPSLEGQGRERDKGARGCCRHDLHCKGVGLGGWEQPYHGANFRRLAGAWAARGAV